MRNLLVLTAVGSVLALGSTAIVAKPVSFDGLVHKVQSGGDKAPGARGQDGGKSAAPGGRDGGGGLGKGQDKGGDRGAGPEKGAGADKADRGGTQMRSGEKSGSQRSGEKKGSQDKQRATERGGRTGVDVDIRGGRGYRSDGRTRIDIDADRRRRSGGRDVDVNVRGGHGYRGGVDCDQIVRRYSMCFRR